MAIQLVYTYHVVKPTSDKQNDNTKAKGCTFLFIKCKVFSQDSSGSMVKDVVGVRYMEVPGLNSGNCFQHFCTPFFTGIRNPQLSLLNY